MPVIFEAECGPKCRSKQHCLEVNSVITKGSLLELQAYSRLCHTWMQHTDTGGRSALHVAAACGKADIVEWLLTEKNQDPSSKDKESGWTALHRALFYGQLATARLLIQLNCRIFLLNCVQCNSDLYTRDHEGLGALDLLTKDRPEHIMFDTIQPNEVYSWGDNSNLTLGHGSEQRRSVPEVVDTFRRLDISVKQVVMCKYHTVFLAHNGQVYTCGHGQGGRLGHGDEATCVTPRLVEALQKEECVQVAAARDHTLFLTEKNCVYSCGLNDCYQLGQTVVGDKSTNKSLLPAKVNVKLLKGKNILGVHAGRFHSVIHTADGIYTCGLNAGQIGQPKGEQFQVQLRQMCQLHAKDTTITKVATSDAAITCFTARGDIFLIHEYSCKKIASRWQDVEKLYICGGHLDHNTDLDVLREKGGIEVRVALLNTTGKVFMWRSSSPTMKRCHFSIRREIRVKDVAINTAGLLIITEQGEAFTGYPSGRKSANVHKSDNKDKEFGKMSLIDLMLRDEVEDICVRRVPVVHRATGLVCDLKGRNFAITQSLPMVWVRDVPCVSESSVQSHFQQLMEEADLCDGIHDCVVQVGERKWPAHRFILASRADYFRKQVPCLATEPDPFGEKPIMIVTDIEPDVMEQMLKFIYTDTCDLLSIGSKIAFCQQAKRSGNNHGTESVVTEVDTFVFDGRKISAFEVNQRRKKGKAGKEERKEEKVGKGPVKILQEAARKFGVKGLAKRLEGVKCVNGVIQASGKKLQPPRIKYERTKLGELYDVCIRADDSTTFQCHKCVLAARLEYFRSMLGCGWLESSDTQSLTLPIPGEILEILLDFVYQDESAIVSESEDLDILCNVLVVADQFLVERLKELCECSLTRLMTQRNVGELLEIATAYNATQLRRTCQEFITLNLPVLLETRNLDMVSDDTMQELSTYYKNLSSKMACRVITPWDVGPDRQFLDMITANFEADPAAKSRDWSSKKPKPKRRQSRNKSISEEMAGADPATQTCLMAERQVSVNSDISTKSEDDLDVETVSSPEVKSSLMDLAKKCSRPISIQSPVKGQGWGLTSPVQLDVGTVGTLPSSVPLLQSPVSPPPGGSRGISLRNIMQEQDVTPKSSVVKPKGGGGRVSWKEVKKQQNKVAQAQRAEATAAYSVSAVSPSVRAQPACPWGSTNNVVQSFRDLMQQDKKSQQNAQKTKHSSTQSATSTQAAVRLATSPPGQSSATTATLSTPATGKSPLVTAVRSPPVSGTSFSWGLPVRIPSQPQPSPNALTEPQPASSPPENPWQRFAPASPPAGAAASVCFSDIVQDQMLQKHCLERAAQKPLHLIQMEEKAISELLKHYRAGERTDERITVERVSGPMAAPLWNRKRTPSASHPGLN